MWFKSLQIYRLPVPWNIDLEALSDQLARGEFTRCPSNQPMSRGWVSPRKDGALIYANNRQWLIALAVEQRLLPPAWNGQGRAVYPLRLEPWRKA